MRGSVARARWQVQHSARAGPGSMITTTPFHRRQRRRRQQSMCRISASVDRDPAAISSAETEPCTIPQQRRIHGRVERGQHCGRPQQSRPASCHLPRHPRFAPAQARTSRRSPRVDIRPRYPSLVGLDDCSASLNGDAKHEGLGETTIPPAYPASSSAKASKSGDMEAAPGSICPALRSPR